MRGIVGACVMLGAIGAVASCGHKDPVEPPVTALTREELLDPESCRGCHSDHYKQWSGSMHAYASVDPLFIAMNARGQRETKGALGDFCVKCHAPLAVAMGVTKDGLNLATVPKQLQGINCYFCHTVDRLEADHNGALHLAGDDVMRGAIADPQTKGVHEAAYAETHDHERIVASDLCGSCHQLQNPHGTELQHTFSEWKKSLFAHDVAGQRITCSGCHMPGKDAPIAQTASAPMRRLHDHAFPAVDIATTDFPESDAMRTAVQANLDPSLVAKLCVTPKGEVQYTLDNAFAGHDFPSGSAYHRRAWVELTAKNAGAIVFTSGAIADDKAVFASADPMAWILGERMKDDSGAFVEMLWTATSTEGSLLPPAVTNVKSDPAYFHSVTRSWDLSTVTFDEVTAKVHIRPIDHDFVGDLISSGDLDKSFSSKITTFTLAGTSLSWSRAAMVDCVP
ncbi:MAG: multiheme c-type cytochrome [Polyangiales bacterium]